jgi:hypothetical protein
MARIGCARVGTIDQDLAIQVAKPKAERRAIARSEKVPGGSGCGGPDLATSRVSLRVGGELVVTRLERRTLSDGHRHRGAPGESGAPQPSETVPASEPWPV